MPFLDGYTALTKAGKTLVDNRHLFLSKTICHPYGGYAINQARELIARQATDFDFSPALLPDEIEVRVRAAGRRPDLVAKKSGTVGMKLDGTYLETTTFRSEACTPGSRGLQVEFVDDITRPRFPRPHAIGRLMIPELSIQVGDDQNSPWHDLTLWKHTLATVDAAPNDVELHARPFLRGSVLAAGVFWDQ